MSDGTVQCWGSNAESQLGNALIASSSTPVAISGLSGPAIAIAAGGYHTCALISDGTVQCWGFNYYGQLGNGTFSDAYPNSLSAPVTVTGLSGVVTIAAGTYHTCALLSNGAAQCWGYNQEGQLGNGTTDTTAPYGSDAPVSVSGLSGAVTISASEFGACALLSNGTAECWGDTGIGQSDTPTNVGLSGATSVGTGSVGNCAVISDGTVQCWGNGPSGFLSSVTTISGLSDVTGVSDGNNFLCAVLSDGTGECLGNNNTGQLGDGTATNSNAPVTVSGLTGAVAVTAGYGDEAFACALLANGTVECWGYNTDGELGNGTTTQADAPVTVIAANGGYGLPSLGATTPATGSEAPQSCALLSGGTLQCWGANAYGQLGNGTTANSDTPVAVNGLSGVAAIAAGDSFNCALLSNGTVQCLGDGYSGQLGNGATSNSGTPVTVSGLSGVTAIAAGDGHACALVSGGTVECWGYNYNGQLGNGSTNNSDVPVTVSGLSGNATAIAAGGYHACAIISGGSVQCWGANYLGQLGDGTINSASYPYGSTTPVSVSGLSGNAIAIVGGDSHTCALISGGTVQCWGNNEEGQLGDGTINSSSPYGSDTAVTVTGLNGAVAIVAGESHTCALVSGGTVQCWGYNADGELGNGTTTRSDVPVTVTGLTGAVAIAAGQSDVCALLADGAVQCWGWNYYGQLGNGTTTNSDVPVATDALAPSLAWSSSDTSVATIDPAAGLATPVAIGATTITSTYGSLTPATTTLNVGAPPAFTSANNTTFIAGTAGSFSVTASGPPSPSLSESGTLPSGVAFDTSTGVLGGTPAAGTGGTYAIHFAATDGLSPDATQSFTLTVDQAPSVTNATSTTFTVGTAGSFTATATGYPAPTFSESGALPSGVTFNTSTSVLSGTPAAASGGDYPIVITANNGTSPNGTQNFTLTVDQSPAIASTNSASFVVSHAGSFTVAATGYPAPALSILGELPSGVTFNSSTGVVSGTPAAGSSGTYNLNFIASNGVGANAVQNFALTVTTGSVAPAITSANKAMFTAGSAGSFTVTATGTPTPTLSSSGTLPSGLTFNSATGVLSGTPAAGSAGVYGITFTANNGVSPNAAQNFTLTVSGLAVASGGTSSASISPGQTATYDLQVIPGRGFSGSVTIACSGAPAGAVCTTSPATVNASGSTPIALMVSVTTTQAASSPGGFDTRHPLSPYAPNFPGKSLALILLLGIACAAMLPMLKSRRGCLLTATALVFLALTACGGGKSSDARATVTPAGQYPLTVTANCTGYSSSVQVSLTVQ